MRASQREARALKVVLSACLILFVAAVLLIDQNSPATGYELSIYESVPVAAWMCLIAAIGGGTGVVVHQAFREQRSKYWALAFFTLILTTSTILLLPVVRGYYLYGSDDTMAHVRMAELTASQHHFQPDNRYPFTHILMAQAAQICGASPELIAECIPVFFTLLFTLFSYLLATIVMPRKGQALLSAASAALFFGYYHVCLYPQALSIMMLPFIFYLWFKAFAGRSVAFRTAFVTVLLVFPFSHPAPAVALIACLLSAEAGKALWQARSRPSATASIDAPERISFEPTLICAVTFLAWISTHMVFDAAVSNLWGWLAGEIRTMPRAPEIENLLATSGLGGQQLIALGLKMYGDNLIYLCLSAFGLLLVASRFIRRRHEVKNLSVLSVPFLVGGPVWVLIFAATMQVTLGRLLGANVMMWATPVFASFGTHEALRRWKRVGLLVAVSVLLCASVLGIYGVYHSPSILQPSWHVTRRDVHGVEWFTAHSGLERRDDFASMGVPLGVALGRIRIPAHFGYEERDTLGESFAESTLLLLGERSRTAAADPVLSQSMISDARYISYRFNGNDFWLLQQDPSVHTVYSNGELEVLLVTGAT